MLKHKHKCKQGKRGDIRTVQALRYHLNEFEYECKGCGKSWTLTEDCPNPKDWVMIRDGQPGA